MGSHRCLVCIRVKVITGEICTVATKLNPLLRDTAIDVTRFAHTEEGDGAALISTSLADRLFFGDPESFRYHGPEFFILIGQIDGTIEAIYTTGCRHYAIVYEASFRL